MARKTTEQGLREHREYLIKEIAAMEEYRDALRDGSMKTGKRIAGGQRIDTTAEDLEREEQAIQATRAAVEEIDRWLANRAA